MERERFIVAMRPRVQSFEVPELGKVYLRALTAGQRDRFSASCWEGEGAERKQNLVGANARLVALVWSAEDGTSLGFTEADLAEMDGAIVATLAELAVEMNGLGAKAAEDAKGNS